MVKSAGILKRLKMELFELSTEIRLHSRREIMDELSIRLKQLLDTSTVVFVVHNKWNFGNQITYYSSEYPIKNLKENSSENFVNLFARYKDVDSISPNNTIFTSNENRVSYLLRIHSDNNYSSIILLECEEDIGIEAAILEKIRVEVEIFLQMIFNHRHDQYKIKRDEFLFDLSNRLHSVHNTEDTIERVIEAIREMFPVFEYTLFMSKDYDTKNVSVKIFDYTNESSTGALAFINNKLQVEQDVKAVETHVYTPLCGRQGVYGVLKITIPQLVTLSEDEVYLLEKFSTMFGRTLERTTLYQSSNQRIEDLEIINEASHELNTNSDSESILAVAKRYILESCNPEEIGVVSYTNDSRKYTILQDSSFYFDTDDGKKFTEYIYNRIEKDHTPLFYGEFWEEDITIQYTSLMVVPLIESGEVLGLIILLHPKPYYFSFDKFKFIKSFVQHVSLALTNTILRERLNKLVITDYLTGLYARTYLDKKITEHMKTNEKGIFILLDIDDFKKINDTYGHIVGDKVLVQVARVMQSLTSHDDIAARWGGEEFAIYLPDKDLEYGKQVAESIRQKVLMATNPSVSISSGVTYWSGAEEDTIRELFIRADEALYKAKNNGKNKFYVFGKKKIKQTLKVN